LRPDQVTQVRGFADQQLRLPGKPEDASNRRVSIIVQYPQTMQPEESKGTGTKAGAASSEAPGGVEAKAPASHNGQPKSAKPAITKPSGPDSPDKR
jgi:chemotaxis protein MotB